MRLVFLPGHKIVALILTNWPLLFHAFFHYIGFLTIAILLTHYRYFGLIVNFFPQVGESLFQVF